MTYSAIELKAERSILRTLGVAAVFKTYNGALHSLQVLPPDDTHSINKAEDFRSRQSDTRFEALAVDVPNDWRDGSLIVNGQTYAVLDISNDGYGNRALIRVE